MQAVRHLLAQRHFAVLICTTALLLKLLVPTGYMVGNDHGVVNIMICSGSGPRTIAVVMPGMADGIVDDGVDGGAAMHDGMSGHGKSRDHGKSEAPCAYSGLSAQVLGAVDPVILVAALAVVAMAALLGSPRPALRPAPHLRPPLRGPPYALN